MALVIRSESGTIRCRGARRSHRRARDRQRRLRARGRGLRGARRRPRRARDEDDAPGVQLGEGAGRDPGRVRRGRLARDPRRGRDAQLARDGRPAARRGAHHRGAVGDPLARGARRRVHARRTAATASPAAAARPASACSRSATAPATRSRRRSARRSRRATAPCSHTTGSTRSSPTESGWRASFTTPDGSVAIDAGDRRPRGRRPLLRARPRSAASSPRTIRTRPAR